MLTNPPILLMGDLSDLDMPKCLSMRMSEMLLLRLQAAANRDDIDGDHPQAVLRRAASDFLDEHEVPPASSED